MRYRERDVSSDYAWAYTTNHSDGDHAASDASGTLGFPREREYERMWDVEVPNFHARSRNGEIFVNTLRQEKYKLQESSNVGFSLEHPGSPVPCIVSYDNADRLLKDNGVRADTTTRLVRTDVLRREASTQAWAELDAAYFEAMTFLAELRETLRFLMNPLKSLYRYYDGIYTRRLPRGMSLWDYFYDNWYAYRYGARPFFADIKGILEAFDHERNLAPKRYTARGFASADSSRQVSSETSTSIFEMENQISQSEEVSIRTGILYEIDKKAIYGMSLRDLPVALWELVPFGFVADWYVNIGDYLRAVTPRAGVRILASWTTEKRISESQATTALVDVSGSTYSLVSSGSYSHSARRESLYRLPYLQPPSLGLRHEAFDFDLGIGRIVDQIGFTDRLIRQRKR